MKTPKKSHHIAHGLFAEFSAHPKLKQDVPTGALLAFQDSSTQAIEHVGLGMFLSARMLETLRKASVRALEALKNEEVLPRSEPPLPVAGLKIKNGDRVVIVGLERDLGDLYLGVCLYRYTRLTREEAKKFWHDTQNKYIVGDILLL